MALTSIYNDKIYNIIQVNNKEKTTNMSKRGFEKIRVSGHIKWQLVALKFI